MLLVELLEHLVDLEALLEAFLSAYSDNPCFELRVVRKSG
jgi:hypothetical protein